MLKAIVFDFDGVLVDSEPLHYEAFRDVMRPLGVDFDYRWYLAELVGFDDRDAFAHVLRTRLDADAPARATPIDELCQRKQDAFERRVRGGIEPIPGAIELVDQAGAQMPIAIASGAVMNDIAVIVEALGRAEAFEEVITADQVARSKPDPESYALAVRRLAERHPDLALSPAECLAIEDTAAGLASARGAGLRTLGLTTTHPADQLDAAERVVDSLTDLSLDDLRAWFKD